MLIFEFLCFIIQHVECICVGLFMMHTTPPPLLETPSILIVKNYPRGELHRLDILRRQLIKFYTFLESNLEKRNILFYNIKFINNT